MSDSIESKTLRRGFMDMVEFQHELGEVLGGNKIYPSVEDLKEYILHWDSCGIVEVEVRMVREVEPQDLMRGVEPMGRAKAAKGRKREHHKHKVTLSQETGPVPI